MAALAVGLARSGQRCGIPAPCDAGRAAERPLAQQWLHGAMEKDEAARLLGKGSPTIGTFFVRERGEADYVLALWFGKPGGAPQATQHLITKNPETGYYCVNKRQIGEAKTIVKFIKQLFEPIDGWCVCGGGVGPSAAPEAALQAMRAGQPRARQRQLRKWAIAELTQMFLLLER